MIVKRQLPKSIYPFPDRRNFTVHPGMSGDTVMIVQIMLNEIRIFHDYYPYLYISGVYNKETESAVRKYQALTRLPQTGIVDLATWNYMAGEYNLTVDGQ